MDIPSRNAPYNLDCKAKSADQKTLLEGQSRRRSACPGGLRWWTQQGSWEGNVTSDDEEWQAGQLDSKLSPGQACNHVRQLHAAAGAHVFFPLTCFH